MKTKRVDREKIRSLIAEEAAYWDSTDTSEMMDITQRVRLEWTAREDRCKRCGGEMEKRQIDLHLAGERLILRGVLLYVCRTPGCGSTQLPLVIKELAERLETLVQETLAFQGISSPEPVLVREEPPPYGNQAP